MTKSQKRDGSDEMSATHLDVSEYLISEEHIISFIESVAEEKDWEFLSRAIGHAAKSIVMSRLANELGVDRATLYAEKSPKSIPIQAIINALYKNTTGDGEKISRPEVDISSGFSQILLDTIQVLSEREFFAGWKNEIEFEIWDQIHSEPQTFGYLSMTQAECTHFKLLSHLSQGWIYYGSEGKKWVSLSEWNCLFADWKCKKR